MDKKNVIYGNYGDEKEVTHIGGFQTPPPLPQLLVLPDGRKFVRAKVDHKDWYNGKVD